MDCIFLNENKALDLDISSLSHNAFTYVELYRLLKPFAVALLKSLIYTAEYK